ncbi:MAG TPA: FAD-binding oxidoreductase [candidate division Zixibacteria bacterium]|nr:FAD-binding oxidoreductase [candidate division Zixibacteria bacterium]
MDFEIIYSEKGRDYNKENTRKKLLEIFGEANVSYKEIDILAYSKDLTLITLRWTLEGKIAAKPDFIVWPENAEQISQLMKYANKVNSPVIPFGSGSGVVGGAIPIFGGIIVDMKKMDKIVEINDLNLTAKIQTGKNGMNIERELNQAGYTLGHIPQSIYTSTLGGYIANKAAGQFSTKYGKIEDMIISMEAVMPTGEIIRSKAAPRTSVGPQVDKLLIGSEGTLALITEATLRIWPLPEKRSLISYAFNTIEEALNSAREILRRQVYPAVVRIYDQVETERSFPNTSKAKNRCMTIFICEGEKAVVSLEEKITRKYCEEYRGISCGEEPVNHWLERRFKVTETSIFPPMKVIFDTIEVSVMWDKAAKLYYHVIKAMKKIDGTVFAFGHVSHFYPQGVGFYFTFAGVPGKSEDIEYYKAVWDACIKATVESGGSIAHHHGIGINRTHWMEKEWESVYPILKKIKQCLDPKNILNPGKLYDGKKE